MAGHSSRPDLAGKLAHLFDTVRAPGGKRYSDEEVARGVGQDEGSTISANYIYLLRTGRRDNPTKRHLEAIARFFRVPPAYFFDDELGKQIHRELELLAALRDTGVRKVALRAAAMPRRQVESLLALMQQLDDYDAAGDSDAGAPDRETGTAQRDESTD